MYIPSFILRSLEKGARNWIQQPRNFGPRNPPHAMQGLGQDGCHVLGGAEPHFQTGNAVLPLWFRHFAIFVAVRNQNKTVQMDLPQSSSSLHALDGDSRHVHFAHISGDSCIGIHQATAKGGQTGLHSAQQLATTNKTQTNNMALVHNQEAKDNAQP